MKQLRVMVWEIEPKMEISLGLKYGKEYDTCFYPDLLKIGVACKVLTGLNRTNELQLVERNAEGDIVPVSVKGIAQLWKQYEEASSQLHDKLMSHEIDYTEYDKEYKALHGNMIFS